MNTDTCVSEYFVFRWLLDENGGKPTHWKDGQGLPSKYFKRTSLFPNYEQARKGRLYLETDYPRPQENKEVANKICECLEKKGVSYKRYESGHKSDWIESDWIGLDELTKEQRQQAKKLLAKYLVGETIAKDLDVANFRDLRGVQIVGQPHRKTKKPKVLIKETQQWVNVIPKEIIISLRESRSHLDTRVSEPKQFKGSCGVLEYTISNKVDEGDRNQVLAPNLMALYPNKAEAFASKQDMLLTDVTGWTNTDFRCTHMQTYAKDHKLNKICELCPHKKLNLTSEQWNEFKLIRRVRFS